MATLNVASVTHASRHATGGADPVTPAAIGAATAAALTTETTARTAADVSQVNATVMTTAAAPTVSKLNAYDCRASALAPSFPAASSVPAGTTIGFWNWVPSGTTVTKTLSPTCAGSDHIDSASSGSTSGSLTLPNEKVWFTSDGVSVWTNTVGNKSTSSLNATFAQFTTGQAIGLAGFNERSSPSFTRYAGNPDMTLANQNPSGGSPRYGSPSQSTTAFAPYTANMMGVLGVTPIDNFYRYYTTNHATDGGGVYLVTGPTPTGPWTFQGKVWDGSWGTLSAQLTSGAVITSVPCNALTVAIPAGSVSVGVPNGTAQTFTTTGAAIGATSIPVTSATVSATFASGSTIQSIGYQTENASVIYNEDTATFHCYYKRLNAGIGQQVTKLVTSTTGLFQLDSTSVDLGVVLDAPAANLFPGDVSFAYFRPFRVGTRWFAHHLIGGSSPSTFGLSYSHDGIMWQTDGRPLMYGSDQVIDSSLPPTPLGQNAIRIEWNSGDVILWRGQLWWFGLLSDYTSGGGAKNARLACAPLSRDLRHLVGVPRILLLPTAGANESVNYQSVHSHVFQGRVYMTYVCDYANFNVAVSN